MLSRIIGYEYWNNQFGIKNGGWIEEGLTPFFVNSVEIAPPEEHIYDRIRAALARISRPAVGGIELVSVHNREAAENLLQIKRDTMQDIFERSFVQRVRLGAQQDRRVRIEVILQNMFRMQALAIYQNMVGTGFYSVYHELANGLKDCVCGFVAASIAQHEPATYASFAFGELFLLGNFPLGMLKGGKFVVLVA